VSVTPIVGRSLERHERQFLALVDRHLRDVPRPARTDAMRAATDHLMDRPPTATEGELWNAVGTPTDYATALRVSHDLGPERTDWWARWIAIPKLRRWIGAIVVLLVVATTIVGSEAYRSWAGWEATIHNNMFSATWLDESDPVAGMTRAEARGEIEVTVPFRTGEVVQIGAMLNTEDEITVSEITLPLAPASNVELLGIETRDPRTMIWEPFAPFTLGGDDPTQNVGRVIRFLVRFTDCVGVGPQSGPILDRFEVRYHGKGRDRTQVIPLRGAVALLC
jgi:hypothetical protein